MIEEQWVRGDANFTKSNEWRGYKALEPRVREAHDKWVRDGGCLFRRRHADTHHGGALTVWVIVAISDGRAILIGQDLLLLAGAKRIREDYQFVVLASG